MKVKFGIGRSLSYFGHKQVFITPCFGVIVARSFPDDSSIIERSVVINLTWLMWGAYVVISRTVRIEVEQDD